MNAIEYKGYEIIPDFVYASADGTPNGKCDFIYYKKGDEHAVMCRDYTLDEVKDEINDKIISGSPAHIVRTNFGQREYYFPWLNDAIEFQKIWGGELLPCGQPILNP